MTVMMTIMITKLMIKIKEKTWINIEKDLFKTFST